MKRFVLTGIVGLMAAVSAAQVPDGENKLCIMFWNLENFFDWQDGGNSSSDREFSSKGERRWTSKRFYNKCNAIAKTLLWTADREGRMPDVLAVAEVENRDVLRRLVNHTILYKYGYAIIHEDSPDPRGIDVALLYRKDRLRLLGSKSVHIEEFRTRDILLANFVCPGRDTVHLLVNHHPSKYGGGESENKRDAVMRRMCSLCDSLSRAEKNPGIVCMGDFNDTPDAPAFRMADTLLVNLAMDAHRKGLGTIRFDGKWETIDMFLVSPKMARKGRMDILMVPFLMTPDKAHSGMKPLRTYSGPRYIGGVSDHLPILFIEE